MGRPSAVNAGAQFVINVAANATVVDLIGGPSRQMPPHDSDHGPTPALPETHRRIGSALVTHCGCFLSRPTVQNLSSVHPHT